MKDGIIRLDSKRAIPFGFTSDRFDGYMWKVGDEIWISFIESKQEGKGHLRALMDAINHAGYRIAVPTPSARMRMICMKRGMRPEWRDDYEVMAEAGRFAEERGA